MSLCFNNARLSNLSRHWDKPWNHPSLVTMSMFVRMFFSPEIEKAIYQSPIIAICYFRTILNHSSKHGPVYFAVERIINLQFILILYSFYSALIFQIIHIICYLFLIMTEMYKNAEAFRQAAMQCNSVSRSSSRKLPDQGAAC